MKNLKDKNLISMVKAGQLVAFTENLKGRDIGFLRGPYISIFINPFFPLPESIQLFQRTVYQLHAWGSICPAASIPKAEYRKEVWGLVIQYVDFKSTCLFSAGNLPFPNPSCV